MSYRRHHVVEHAITVLDAYGLGDLSMRRLGAELGVQPSALYHHFKDKQTLLAAVADEILARGERPLPAGNWPHQVTAICAHLRDAMLAYRDGAELVATVSAFGIGARAPYDALVGALSAGGLDDPDDARDGSDFAVGLAIVVDGIRVRVGAPVTGGPSGPR